MRAKLTAAEAAFRWQREQVELLEGVAPDDDVTQWPVEDMARLLTRAGVVAKPADLKRIHVPKLAKDLSKVLRIFEWTCATAPAPCHHRATRALSLRTCRPHLSPVCIVRRFANMPEYASTARLVAPGRRPHARCALRASRGCRQTMGR